MADIAGVSFSIAQPILNSGVNQLREPENQESAEKLRATSAPQRDQPVNSEPADVPAEQSLESRLNFSVPTAENTTEENTTEINEQVVQAAEQQIQQTSVEANARRPEIASQNNIEATSQQTNDDLAANSNQAPPQQNVNVEATNTTDTNTDQEPAANSPQNQTTENTQSSQNTGDTTVENVEQEQSQVTIEQLESRNPETGLGLNSGSIIDVTA